MYAIRTAHTLNAKYQKQLTVNVLKTEPYLNKILITNFDYKHFVNSRR